MASDPCPATKRREMLSSEATLESEFQNDDHSIIQTTLTQPPCHNTGLGWAAYIKMAEQLLEQARDLFEGQIVCFFPSPSARGRNR